jgi:hypothetical protein
MKTITVTLTDDMDIYHDDISKFLDLMVHKLHKNVHKGRWENIKADDAFMLLRAEMKELMTAILENNKDEAYLECADVANFAMIIASIMRERGI